jgi:hypothetical protein
MTYKYLQDYIYYSALYDSKTIDVCECWDSEAYDEYVKSGEKFDLTKPSRRLHKGLVADLTLYFKVDRLPNQKGTLKFDLIFT